MRIILALAAVLPFAALAAESEADKGPWAGEVSAGYVATSGNTETSSTNGKLELIYDSKLWRNTFNASALHSKNTTDAPAPLTGTVDVVTAEQYKAGDKLDFNFTEHDYAFVAVEWELDRFGAIRERTSETLGYGRKILTGPLHTLELEIGGGARQLEAQGSSETSSDSIGRGRIAYRWNFSEASFFGQTVKVESGKNNTSTESVTEVKLTLIGKLFATASFTLRNNSDVPPLTEKTDTITTFGLGWSFGK